MTPDVVAPLDRACEAALAALRAGDYDETRRMLADAGFAQHPPGATLVRFADALDAERNGDVARALAGLDDALAEGTSLPELLYLAARCFVRRADAARAYGAYARLAALGHDYWHEFLALAFDRPAAYGSVVHHVFERDGAFDLALPMRLKDALCERLPVDAAFAAYRDAMRLPPATGLRRKRLVPLVDAAREAGAAYVEHRAGGAPAVMRAPRVAGPGACPDVHGRDRAIFVAAFDDARVRARSSLIAFGDDLLLDAQTDELRDDLQLTIDPSAFARDGDAAYAIDDGEIVAYDEIARLGGATSAAFGHWIWEYVLQWTALRRELPPGTPVAIDHAMPASHREALAFFSDGATPIVELGPGQTLHARRLWVASNWLYVPMRPPTEAAIDLSRAIVPQAEAAAAYQALAARIDADPACETGPRRVYLARPPGLHRRLVNAAEIEAAAHAAGYAIVYPERLTFREQLALVRGATHLAGPEGSAFFLAVFARPGTRVCVLSHPYVASTLALTTMLEAVPLDVTVVTGPFVAEDPVFTRFSDYAIDVELFTASVGGLAHA